MKVFLIFQTVKSDQKCDQSQNVGGTTGTRGKERRMVRIRENEDI